MNWSYFWIVGSSLELRSFLPVNQKSSSRFLPNWSYSAKYKKLGLLYCWRTWMFPRIGGKTPQIIHFNRVFHYHYKPSILGVFPLFLETPTRFFLKPSRSKSLQMTNSLSPVIRKHEKLRTPDGIRGGVLLPQMFWVWILWSNNSDSVKMNQELRGWMSHLRKKKGDTCRLVLIYPHTWICFWIVVIQNYCKDQGFGCCKLDCLGHLSTVGILLDPPRIPETNSKSHWK